MPWRAGEVARNRRIRRETVSAGLPRGMTYSQTMQEPLPARPAPVSGPMPAGGRKEMTMNRASRGIVVGFAGQP